MIIEELEEIGLKKKEAVVYNHLLSHGDSSASQVSKYTKYTRTAVYPILNNLIDIGLVIKKTNRGVSSFSATSPSAIQTILAKKEADIKRKKLIATKLVRKLALFDNPHADYVFNQTNIEKKLYDSLDLWFASTKNYDDTLWGYQTPEFVAQYRTWLGEYWRRKSPSHRIQLFSHLLGHEIKLEKKIPNRTIKSLPTNKELKSTIWVNGDYITLINTSKNNDYMLQIKDKALSIDLRSIFKLLWEST